MHYIYGPVPSRRLGFSLGVDIVSHKICTLDCIYCQLGRTTHKRVKRKSFAPSADIIDEIRKSVSAGHDIDFITFSGSGEPTLNSDIGSLIHEVRKITSIPVAVLTNGTLLFREDVQKDLMEAHVVIPSLDAVSPEMFQRINRPHHSLTIQSIMKGMRDFREKYTGQIWLEIMFIKNFNADRQELSEMKKAIAEIRPDKVYLNTVSRPPSEVYAEPLSATEMRAIKDYLGGNCEVIAEFHKKRSPEGKDVKGSIVEMTKRRPITVTDIANVLGISETNAESILERLMAEGTVTEKQYGKKNYYIFSTKKRQDRRP
jgi:wyosine [tRNA(Phe)-imidazoG37] synthetase (radical SAM superfamily)